MRLGAQSFYHGVPVIVLPIILEQPWHAKQAQHLGAGIDLDVATPINTQELAGKLSAAFSKMLSTDAYLLRARHISMLMRAQRWSPVEKAASERPLDGIGSLCLLPKASWKSQAVLVR